MCLSARTAVQLNPISFLLTGRQSGCFALRPSRDGKIPGPTMTSPVRWRRALPCRRTKNSGTSTNPTLLPQELHARKRGRDVFLAAVWCVCVVVWCGGAESLHFFNLGGEMGRSSRVDGGIGVGVWSVGVSTRDWAAVVGLQDASLKAQSGALVGPFCQQRDSSSSPKS